MDEKQAKQELDMLFDVNRHYAESLVSQKNHWMEETLNLLHKIDVRFEQMPTDVQEKLLDVLMKTEAQLLMDAIKTMDVAI
jgi:hypothetical protein